MVANCNSHNRFYLKKEKKRKSQAQRIGPKTNNMTWRKKNCTRKIYKHQKYPHLSLLSSLSFLSTSLFSVGWVRVITLTHGCWKIRHQRQQPQQIHRQTWSAMLLPVRGIRSSIRLLLSHFLSKIICYTIKFVGLHCRNRPLNRRKSAGNFFFFFFMCVQFTVLLVFHFDLKSSCPQFPLI